MATIEFHCNHCGHLVRTKDENAGKRGRCPHCHQSVYIPTPREQLEPLSFASEQQTTEAEDEREAEALLDSLREERGEIPEVKREPLPDAEGDVRLPSDTEMLVIEYALAMAAGDLDKAESYADELRSNPQQARDVIDRIEMDEVPHERLGNIPRPVLLGFLKQLRAGQ